MKRNGKAARVSFVFAFIFLTPGIILCFTGYILAELNGFSRTSGLLMLSSLPFIFLGFFLFALVDKLNRKQRQAVHRARANASATLAQNQRLAVPCSIVLRKKASAGKYIVSVYLNRVKIGEIKSGESISFNTNVVENEVYLTKPNSENFINFTAQPNGQVMLETYTDFGGQVQLSELTQQNLQCPGVL